MYEKVKLCPVCNSQEFKNHIICTDHSISGESFALTKCAQCDLLLTNPRPSQENIGKYYESEDYISHTNEANNLTNFIYKLARSYTFYTKHKLLKNTAHKNTLLDYGCGTGDFLHYCKSKGWDTYGLEPDNKARSIAQQKNQNNIIASLDDLNDEKFSVITLWHVLEHVHDLNSLLKQLRSRLEEKGRLVIAVPNVDAYDAKIYKEHWAAYDVPRHLFHFNQLTFRALINKNKFKVKAIHPMKLDAFYVSLLSEKYLGHKNGFIKSLTNGWKSNRWAKKNNNNYSSLIYILKK